ncbi:MAG: hypothetical protein Kow0031_26890 [Anaerolineae bacterium]
MQQQQIEQAIATLESRRDVLGSLIVETSLAALRHQLNETNHHSVPDSALRGERKQVTVMFADISGFTAMSEKLDPEEVRSMINACFERLGKAIDRYGGHIDKFIGDEIMALFGAPLAHENDPERALRAALDMMAELEAFNQEHAAQLPKPLALHFGINSGLVIAGGIGTRQRQDYSVMGDTVNLAARLEDLSESGEILVGENTYRLAAALFEFEPLPPVNLKGKAQPVRVFRLLKARAVAAGQVRGIEGLHSPLVGRASEMALLTGIMQRFLEGHGSVVSVVGEAGLGKSRLVAELQSSCEQATEHAVWASGRALSHADNASYLVARDTLRHLLAFEAGMPPAEVAQHLHNQIEAALPGQSAEIYPFLAHLFDLPLHDEDKQRVAYLSGGVLHQRILQAAQQFIVGQAQQMPLALIWEDLHWADPSSLELLESLLPLARQHPLLLVLIHRRPIKGSKIWHFHQNVCQHYANSVHQAINLPPLTDADSHQLLQNLLGADALPEPTRRAIVQKAEGNPFYLEEVIRSLIHSGDLTFAGGRWSASTRLDRITLPDSLQGVIMARIDQLDPQSKRVLQIASVIGRNFPVDVLASVLQQQQQ